MIIDIPSEGELELAAVDLLVMAWEAAIDAIRVIRRSAIEEWDTDGRARAEYEAARQPGLRHAHVWIHQAQELGLKARIAGVTPYVLLIGDPRSWPRPGASGEVSFNDFRTTDASDLVRVHDTVCPTRLPPGFVRLFEEGRRNRNRIVHLGGLGVAADARDLIVRVLQTAATLFPSRPWAAWRIQAAFNHPEAVLHSDAVEWGLLQDFEIVVETLTPSELRRHFDYHRRRRGYACLDCSSEQRDHEPPSRYAQLVTAEGDALFCPICTITRRILRESCAASGCRSDVLWGDDYKIGTCLWCLDRNAHRYRAQADEWLSRRVEQPEEAKDEIG